MIRSLFEGEIRMTVTVSGEPRDPIPALRSQLDFMIDTYMQGGMEFRFYYDGETVMRPGDPDDPTDPAALEKPGVVSFFTEEAREELVSVLDRAGSPIMGTTDQQILEIAGEEMSALFAGSCTAEECARRIQSRVGILLAEGK